MEQRHAEHAAALENLAGELTRRGYQIKLVAPLSGPPSLTVRNPRAKMLTETVVAASGWYWYSWAERIAPVGDVSDAAAHVARVLRAVDESTEVN